MREELARTRQRVRDGVSLRQAVAESPLFPHLSPRLRARTGMTLIELTVGIVVTGLVVSAGYAAFSTIIDQRDRAAQVAAATAHSVGIRQTIFQWLDGARPILRSPGMSINPQAVYELHFTTHAMTPMRALTTEIRLFIDNGRSGYGHGLVAVFRPVRGNETSRKDSIRVVLDSTARDLVIDYLTDEDGTRQWHTQDYLFANPRPMRGASFAAFTFGSGNRTVIATRLRVISDDPIVSAAFANPVVTPITMGLGL